MARYKLCNYKKIKNKVPLPQVFVSLVDFGYPVRPLFFMLPKLLNNLFGFPIFLILSVPDKGVTCGVGTANPLTEDLSSPSVISGVHVARSLVFLFSGL